MDTMDIMNIMDTIDNFNIILLSNSDETYLDNLVKIPYNFIYTNQIQILDFIVENDYTLSLKYIMSISDDFDRELIMSTASKNKRLEIINLLNYLEKY